MFNVNNKNNRTTFAGQISGLIFGVFIVNFEHIS